MFNISISNQDGKLVTTSRNIAEVFGKEHKNVIRAIESLECGEDFNRLNFELVTYTDAKGEQRPEYLITRDGFTLLAMGFTGKGVARIAQEFCGMTVQFLAKREQG